jgi:hypothetical protein
MKTTTTLLAACSLLSAASLTSWADTAYTDPVMASSTTLTEGLNVVGVTALNSIEATGVINSIDSVGTDGYTTLIVSDVPSDWATYDESNQGWIVKFNGIDGYQNVPMYYLEMTSGAQEGLILDVYAIGAGAENTLTVGIDLTGQDASFADQTFVIRKKHTIADVFGENNETGLASGTSFSKSDLVYVYINGQFEMFFYQDWPDAYDNDGWRQVRDSETPMGNICIDPDFGIIVYIREGGTTVDLMTAGDVKLGTARTVFTQGLNPINMKFPVGMTLGNSGLYNSSTPVLQGGTSFSSADLVYIFKPDDAFFEIYFYQDWPDSYNNDGWRQARDSTTPQDDVEIVNGTMIIVFRRGVEPVEWTMLQPFSL